MAVKFVCLKCVMPQRNLFRATIRLNSIVSAANIFGVNNFELHVSSTVETGTDDLFKDGINRNTEKFYEINAPI